MAGGAALGPRGVPYPRTVSPSGRRRGRPRRPPAQRSVMRSHWRADGQPKARFVSEDEANRAAFSARLDHGSDLSAYRCEMCGGWHLGNAPE